MNTLPDTEFLKVSDIQHLMNIGTTSAYALTHMYDFPVCTFGKAIRIPRDAFLDWLEAHTYNPRRYGVED